MMSVLKTGTAAAKGATLRLKVRSVCLISLRLSDMMSVSQAGGAARRKLYLRFNHKLVEHA
jgi:hypothetical protein